MSIPFGNPRRLPVYLLLDCSGSMSGTKIVQVNQGVQLIYQELMADPRSASTVHISIIAFESTAYQMDLIPITQFTPQVLTTGGGTSLGAALGLLNQSLDSDLKPNVTGQKGDFKPLVFLLTDGMPTDTWQAEAQRLQTRSTGKAANIIAIAIGQDADVGVLQQIAKTVIRWDSLKSEDLRPLFVWISASIKTASAQATNSGEGGVALPPPPAGAIVVDL
jgi:uncharacterized protein YegL